MMLRGMVIGPQVNYMPDKSHVIVPLSIGRRWGSTSTFLLSILADFAEQGREKVPYAIVYLSNNPRLLPSSYMTGHG